jgi:hypothetical protein
LMLRLKSFLFLSSMILPGFPNRSPPSTTNERKKMNLSVVIITCGRLSLSRRKAGMMSWVRL